jgi:hypothetical protein
MKTEFDNRMIHAIRAMFGIPRNAESCVRRGRLGFRRIRANTPSIALGRVANPADEQHRQALLATYAERGWAFEQPHN